MGTSREFLVGLVFFGLLLLLGVFTIVLTDVRIGPEPPSVRVYFEDVEGLEEGDDVWINGFRSGKVAKVLPNPETNEIEVKVYFDFAPRLYDDALFQIRPASPLGGRILAIQRGSRTSGEFDLHKKRVGTASADVLTAASKFIEENRPRVEAAVDDIRRFSTALAERGPQILASLQGTLGDAEAVAHGLREGQIDVKLTNALAAVEGFAKDLRSSKGALGAFLYDEDLRGKIVRTLGNIETLSMKLQGTEGTFGKLVNGSELHDRAVAILDRADQILGDVEGVTGQLSPRHGIGRALTQDDFWDRLDTAMVHLDETIVAVRDSIRSPDNMVGMLLNDRELSTSVRRSVMSLGALIEDTRENAPIATFAGFLFSAF